MKSTLFTWIVQIFSRHPGHRHLASALKNIYLGDLKQNLDLII